MFKFVSARIRNLSLVAVVVLVQIGASGMSTAAAQSPDEPSYRALVDQLGGSSFRQREMAARRLREAGLAAKPALLRALKEPDLEIRMQAHRVLVDLMQVQFESRLDRFIEQGDTDESWPGWRLFQQQAGTSRHARRLYAEMIRAESPLLDTLSGDTDSMHRMFGQRLETVQKPVPWIGRPEPISRGSLVAFLLVGARIRALDAEQGGSQYSAAFSRLYSLLRQSSTEPIVLQGEQAQLVQRFLVHWMKQEAATVQSSSALQLALKYDLGEPGLEMARGILKERGGSGSTIPMAAIITARYGGPQDARYLIPHLDNTTVFHTWSNTRLKKEPIRIQVRDVVLAMLFQITGQDPKACGFKLLDPYPETLYRIWTFGFLEESERDAARARWDKWCAAHGASLELPAKSVPAESRDSSAPEGR